MQQQQNITNLNEPIGKQTETLLKSISARLSAREDCRKIPYTVIIDEHGVRMNPIIYVFPNRFKRQDADKMDVVSFVHRYRLKGALLPDFVFGTYVYELTLDGKRRKWRKVD